MKKSLFALLVTGLATTTIAMSTLDFNSAYYNTPNYFRCNGVKITPQSTVNNLAMNCSNAKVIMHTEPTTTNNTALSHNPNGGSSALAYVPDDDSPDTILDKVKFNDDKGSYLICYFNNQVLKKCKYKEKKPLPQTKAAASQPAATTTLAKNNSSAAQ
jgi:hypothetical protein